MGNAGKKWWIGFCICFSATGAFVLPFGDHAAKTSRTTKQKRGAGRRRTRGCRHDHRSPPVVSESYSKIHPGVVLFHASSSGQMSGMDEEGEASPSTSSSTSSTRSIGEVVQGLHGSKYQFGQAGVNYEGQQFAETGYGSSSIPKKQNYESEPLPDWAIRRREQHECNIPSNAQVLKLDKQGKVTFTITNDERSWEKYHIFWMGNDASKGVVQVHPSAGMLAPRGTSTSDGYSDSETISVVVLDPKVLQGGWILAITEADTWKFRIDL